MSVNLLFQKNHISKGNERKEIVIFAYKVYNFGNLNATNSV